MKYISYSDFSINRIVWSPAKEWMWLLKSANISWVNLFVLSKSQPEHSMFASWHMSRNWLAKSMVWSWFTRNPLHKRSFPIPIDQCVYFNTVFWPSLLYFTECTNKCFKLLLDASYTFYFLQLLKLILLLLSLTLELPY